MFPDKALGDLPLEIIDGDRGANYPKTNEFSERGHCLFLNAGNVSASGFSFSDTAFISEEKDQLLRKGKAQRDDVILTTRGTVGNLALYDESVPFEHVRINSGMVLMRPDKTALDPEFLYYALRSPAFSRQVASLQTGSAQPQLPIRDIKHLRIPFPDLSQQKEVSKRVKLVFDKIELNRRMNETLEEMARALFRDWFVDFGPTRRQAEGVTDPAAIMGHAFPPEKATTLAPLFPAKLSDDGLPEGWETRPLNTVVEQQKQTVKPDQHLDETFEHFSLPAFDKAKWPTVERGAEIKSNKTAVPANSLLISKLNPRIERVWVPQLAGEHRQICSTEFLCFKPAAGIGRATAEALFRSDAMREKMAAMVTGTSNSHQRVPPKVLMQADVLLPEDCANAFENVALPLLEKRQANEHENQTLAEMRDLLLPKLMSGEIRLKDAEAAV
ncbi:MAG: restriction endonuclease subunit S [Aquisalinus sp.]|nr:restriction endonuclease subunit S [Aquisalinus sp.]